MERFSQRESVLLGYNLQRPLTNPMNSSSSKTSKPFRNSDVDFHDVFGGPPRRFSMQEVRPGFRVAADQDDDDDDDEHNEPWPVLVNKPVFGDDRASRRRLPSADFFNDIFGGGGASVHSTPKRHGRDYVFPASPGSRALSPLPPKAEPFGASSLLSQFSLPGKVSKAVEVPTFGSSSRSQHKHKDGSPNGIPHSLSSGTSLPRFSIEAVQTNEARSSPFSSEDSPKSDKADGDPKKNSESSKGNSATSNGLFHFSVYKWKTKGVPLDIPLRGKANSGSSKDFAKSEPLSGINRDDDNNNKARNIASQSSNKTTPLAVESCSNGRSLPNGHSSTLEHSNKLQNGFSHDEFTAEKEAPSAVKNEPDKAFVPSKEEPMKPEVKTVHSLFYDDLEKGLDVSTNGSSSSVVGHTKTTKKQERKNTSSTGSAAANKVNRVQFSPRRESNGRSKVKGRVKDFVKMFNQESSPKTQDGNMFRNKSCKWNEKCAFEDEEKLNTPKDAAEKFKMPKAKANEDLKQSAKVHASGPDSSTPTSGSLSDGSKATAEEIHESFHDNFQVKEITQDENGQLGSVTQNQEFQGIDAKIRHWTKGKEGNIRSLLSTLQYVLWAESGWRPVPLVDIIEGNAVKRAYQKALLCLHPDKLQQKGAASHQKYLAEKVFDILQEAWNYFNSLGAV